MFSSPVGLEWKLWPVRRVMPCSVQSTGLQEGGGSVLLQACDLMNLQRMVCIFPGALKVLLG